MMRRMKTWMDQAKPETREYILVTLHRLSLLRMSAEAFFSRVRLSRRPRIIATACWHFPIYSQTFVYREVAELAKSKFEARFLYSELTSRSQLPEDFSMLWKLKRKLILSNVTAALDMEYYRRRMPEKVEEVARLIARASGMTPEQVQETEHFKHAFSFTRMAECWRADYIHSYFFYERTLFALVASYLLGVPRGVSCYADHMMQDYALKLIPLQMQSCDVVVATSGRIKQELETLAGRTLPHVVVKPNAIDVRQFPMQERLQTQLRLCRVTTVSRIHPKKGLLYLVEAAAILKEQGFSIVVRILGDTDAGDPESEAYSVLLREKIAALKLEDIVLLEGRKSGKEVRQYLGETDVFVAPFIELPNGDKDGIPTALLEAMAAGCTIVSTDAGSILEVIRDNEEGLLVSQRDSSSLAKAIGQVIQDKDLRSRMSRAAMARVEQEFDIRSCESRFHDRLDGVIGKTGPHAAQRVAAV